ncbi:hypothetical protein [uncultured Algimonas sp.]|uniref:hypothetical protein n=1 Tax=uncultured Algimonas sp. TaxID=1547920 RepID=UPI002618E587|nr:hypothetical protein [uncultured Algimonas sp.]
MIRFAALLLLVLFMLAVPAKAEDLRDWERISSADRYYLIHESLSLRRPIERYLVLEYWGRDGFARADGWTIRGVTFRKDDRMNRAISLRQLLHAEGEAETVRKILARLENFDWSSLDAIDDYGNPSGIEKGKAETFIVCGDGSMLRLIHRDGDSMQQVRRHSCAGRTALDELIGELAPLLAAIDGPFGRDFIKPLTSLPDYRPEAVSDDSRRP